MDQDRVLEAFKCEAAELDQAVAGLPAAEWHRPTRCAPWRVRDLFGHVCVGVNRLPGMLAEPPLGAEIPDPATRAVPAVPAAQAAEASSADGPAGEVSAVGYYRPDRRFTREANEARISAAQEYAASEVNGSALAADFAAAWRRVHKLCRAEPQGRVVRTRHGDAMIQSAFLLTRVMELAVHGLDLADALEREPWLTPQAGSAVQELLLGEDPGQDQAEALRELGWDRPGLLRRATGRAPVSDEDAVQLERLGIRWLALG